MGCRFPLLMLLYCLMAAAAYPATYYIDSATGRDTAAGTSPATAWRTLNRVNGLVLKPGDTVLLRRGGLWREKMYADDSGTAALPITIGAYSTGPDPILNGADLVTNFQSIGGGLHAAALATAPEQVFINGVRGTHQGNLAGLLQPGDWLWEAGQLTLRASAAPANVEATVRQYLVDSGQVDYVAIRDIAFEKAIDPLRLFGASNVTLERLHFSDSVGYAAILLSAIGGGRGQNNTIRDCQITGMMGSSQSIAHANNGAGIFIWGLSTCRNNRIEGCTISNNGNAGILLIDTASNVITGNVVSGNGSGGVVVSGLDS
ncbi:MAG: right-handed parallel beta-helix repeat-containing protein, partial [Candidatus Hydrogenedentes bacterium]|nr:right-handed parallel beta-helix repeat-containing protein [Candidatus Hydrogenedentota bacterium]